MEDEACLELVFEDLHNCRGVETFKILSADEEKRILEVEGEAEEKIAYGMCPTVNQGIREALQRDYTVAIIMDTSIFEYPNQPYMVMTSENDVVGEQVRDPEKIEELKSKKVI